MSNFEKFQNIVELLRRIRQLFKEAADLLDFPNINDMEDVYSWWKEVLALCSRAADYTKTEIDNKVIDALINGPFASLDSFKPYYNLFIAVIDIVDNFGNIDTNKLAVVQMNNSRQLAELATKLGGMDPDKVLKLLVEIVKLIINIVKD